MSRFALAKGPSSRRRHATQRRSVVHYDEGLVSQWRRELRSYRPEGVILASQRKRGLCYGGPKGLPQKYCPPQRRRVLRRGGPKRMGTMFLPSTFKIYHVIKINYG